MPQTIQIADIGRRDLPDAGNPTANASPSAFGALEGQAIGNAGAALQGAAKLWAYDQNQRQNYDFQSKYTDWSASEQNALEDAKRAAKDTNAYDFTKTQMAGFDQRAQQFLSQVPESERPKWQAQISSLRSSVVRQAFSAELSTRDTYQQTDLSNKFDELQTQIDQNPQMKDKFLADGEKLIDASNLPPGVKESLKGTWREKATAAEVKAQIARNPGQAAVDLGGNSNYVRKTISRESGGDPNAKNALSSATGLGQFTDGTWSEVVNSPQGKAAGLTMDGRRDPGQSARAIQIYAELNTPKLKAARLDPSERNLRLAHFLGPGGAIDIIKATQNRPNAIAADILPKAAAVNQSVFYASGGEGDPTGRGRALTVSELYNKVTAGFSGDPVPVSRPDAYSDLSYAQRLQARSQAEQAVIRQQQQVSAQQEAAYNNQVNTLQTSLIDGTQGRGAVDAARASGWLTDADTIQKMYKLADAKTEQHADTDAFFSKTDGWNALDKDHKRVAEAGFQALGANEAAASAVWQKTGILPESAATALRGALISNNPDRMKGALNMLSNMLYSGQNAFGGVTGGKELQEAAIEYDHQVNGLVRTPDDAVRRVAEMMSPEYQSKVKVLDADVKKFRETLAKNDPTSEVLSAFDTNGWLPGGTPKIDASQKGAMLKDYGDLAQEHFEKFGNVDSAKAYAVAQMKRVYGVSNGMLMKYPPERVYPPTSDGKHDYIYDQAKADVLARTGKTAERVILTPLPGALTAEPWRQRQPAPYAVTYVYKDANGQEVMDTINSSRFADRAAPFVADVRKAESDLAVKRATAFSSAVADRTQANAAATSAGLPTRATTNPDTIQAQDTQTLANGGGGPIADFFRNTPANPLKGFVENNRRKK